MSSASQSVLALRIAARLRDIPRHRAALDLAVAAFGPVPDAASFAAAWRSEEPASLVRAYAVQSGFENLQNHIAGLARDGLELAGEAAPGESANASRDLHRLARLGAVPPDRCARLVDAQRLRNGVQHAYVESTPEDVLRAVQVLLREIGPFLDGYRRWLKASIASSGAYPSPS